VAKIKSIQLATAEEIQEWNGSFEYRSMVKGESYILSGKEAERVYGGKRCN